MIEFVTLRDRDLSDRRTPEWHVTKSRFEACRFENLRVDNFCFGAGPWMSEYVDCSFDGSHIRAMVPGQARFVRCSFRNVRLRKWLLNHMEFIDCVFSGSLSEINFTGMVPESDRKELRRTINVYRGNDFSGAEFKSVAFRGGIDLSEQRLPEGEGYILLSHAEPVIAAALGKVDEWTEPEERRTAWSHLEGKMDAIQSGQQQLLLSPHDFTSRNATQDRAYQRLRAVILDIVSERGGVENDLPDVRPAPHLRSVRGYVFHYFRAPDSTAAMRLMDQFSGAGGDLAFDVIEAKAVEPFIVLGQFVALAKGVQWSQGLVPLISVWPPEDAMPASIEEYNNLPEDAPWKKDGPTLQLLDNVVRDMLADVDDEQLPKLASRWAQIGELKRFSDVDAASLLPLVTDLVGLARRARLANERLYCLATS